MCGYGSASGKPGRHRTRPGARRRRANPPASARWRALKYGQAVIEDIDARAGCGIDRREVMSLALGD